MPLHWRLKSDDGHLSLKGVHLDMLLPFSPSQQVFLGELDARKTHQVIRPIPLALIIHVVVQMLAGNRTDVSQHMRSQRPLDVVAKGLRTHHDAGKLEMLLLENERCLAIHVGRNPHRNVRTASPACPLLLLSPLFQDLLYGGAIQFAKRICLGRPSAGRCDVLLAL